ncbi:LysM peptidoglycan-binding domain-containing protein [Actinomyces procaprae]|uniref:LysM peptidoglycan-binding domain-containing protein n=1 Tax=Actinomyces procaprae TaxID=2560010 RepID=UPI001F01CB43|nr:LysM domain-containing protein [Actinomyces procaprae]
MSASTRIIQSVKGLSGRAALGLVGLVSFALVPVLLSAATTSARSLLELPLAWWGPAQFSAAITAVACGAGAAGALWHLLSVILALLACSDGRRGSLRAPGRGARAAARILRRWGAPVVRRIAAGALIAGMSSSPALAATTAAAPGSDDLGWQPTQTAPTDPGDSGTGSSPTDPGQPQESPAPTPGHTVTAGESLWSITEDLIGPEASPAQVAEAWPQLYRANTDVIGSDPELILPGTPLSVPGFTDEAES